MNCCKIIPGFKYFDSQEPDEQVVFIIRRHWTILGVPFFFGGILLILELAASVFGGPFVAEKFPGLGEAVFISVMCILLIFTNLYVFLAWLIRYLNIVILTNEHLVEIKQLAVFSRKISELDLDCIEDATASQKGVLATMLHYGEVLVQTAGEMPNFQFAGLEDPTGVQQKIMETKEKYMKQNHFGTTPAPANNQNNPEGQEKNLSSPN